MIQSACERIKELENELAEVKVAYEGMRSQRDNLKLSIEDALRWIECEIKDFYPAEMDTSTRISFEDDIVQFEKILKEHLKNV